VERNAARSSAWLALHLTLTFSSGRIATHRANFSAGAFCRMQLILRSGGCGAVGGCRTFFGVAGFAPEPNF